MPKSEDEKERELLSVCSICKRKLADDEPRGFWIQGGKMGIHCIPCTDADVEAVKIGSLEHPVQFDKEGGDFWIA